MGQLVNTLEQGAQETPENAQPVTEQAPAQETPENATAEDQTPQKFAGRYNSVEELEAGYEALNKQQGAVGQELGELRNQLKDQNSAMQEMLNQQNQPTPEPSTDYDALRGDIAMKMDNGDMTIAEGMLATRKLDAQESAENAERLQQQVLQNATQEFQTELQRRDEMAQSNRFHEKNPDFATLQESGVFEQIKNDNEFIMDDYQAFLQYNADQAYVKGKSEATKEIEGSAPAADVVSSPGSAMKNETPVSTGRSLNKAELLDSGLDAWNQAGG